MIVTFDPVAPTSVERIEFVIGLPTGASLTSAVWSVDMMPANDAAHPLVLSDFQLASPVVNCLRSGGVIGRYLITCTAPASNGETYVESGYLDIEAT